MSAVEDFMYTGNEVWPGEGRLKADTRWLCAGISIRSKSRFGSLDKN